MTYIPRPIEVDNLQRQLLPSFDISLFTTEVNKNQELYTLLIDVLNKYIQIESDIDNSFEKIFNQVNNKYILNLINSASQSLNDLENTNEIVKALISESGYSYLLDVGLTLDTNELSVLYYYLKLLHYLKGTREGLELVFLLLGYDVKLIEWWEKNPKDEVETFEMEIERQDLGSLTKEEVLRIKIFVRLYVYPILTNIIQKFRIEFGKLGIGLGGYADKEIISATTNPIVLTNTFYYDQAYHGTLE